MAGRLAGRSVRACQRGACSDVDLTVRSAALSSALTVHEFSATPAGAPTRESILARLLAFAQVLQDVTSFGDLLDASRAEVESTTGYAHAWLMVKDESHPTRLRLLETSSTRRDDALSAATMPRTSGTRSVTSAQPAAASTASVASP